MGSTYRRGGERKRPVTAGNRSPVFLDHFFKRMTGGISVVTFKMHKISECMNSYTVPPYVSLMIEAEVKMLN